MTSKVWDMARLKIPQDKPTLPEEGMFRYNPTIKAYEGYINGVWRAQQKLAQIVPGSIGTPGDAGFGVGVYTGSNLTSLGLSPMYGCEDPLSENYGNYLHTTGSIMCYIPKFYYRLGNISHPLYAEFGDNLVEVVGKETFETEAEANVAGFILHRAFIDGGVEQDGFFIDKYIASKSPDNANIAVSRRFGNPISLTTATNYTRSNGMTGCVGQLHDAIVLSKARGGSYNNASAFMYSALAMLSLSHAEFSSSSTYCAWYDASYTKCYPKGCNNNALGDVNDDTIKYTSAGDAGNSAKPLVGSLYNLAKASHNGQGSGVIDINGSMWEVALGLTMPGSSSTASGTIANNNLYVLKESISLSSLTNDWNTATSAWGTSANLDTKYDLIASGVSLSGLGDWIQWGNGDAGVFYTQSSGGERALSGIIPPTNNELSSGGINLLGNDGLYRYTRENLYVLFGADWYFASSAGVFSRYFSRWRSDSSTGFSFRSATYG
jgi:hypothetical protein